MRLRNKTLVQAVAVAALATGLYIWLDDDLGARTQTRERESTSSSTPPSLVVRVLPDTPAGRGEAVPGPTETWDDIAGDDLDQLEDEVIVGRVLGPNGESVDGIDVTAELDDSGVDVEWESETCSTDEHGQFVFEGLPEGRFRLTAHALVRSSVDRRIHIPTSDGLIGPSTQVVVEGVEAGRRDVRIRWPLRPQYEAGFAVRVRVLDPSGRDVPAWGYTRISQGSIGSTAEGKVEPEPDQAASVTVVGLPPIGLIIEDAATEDWAPLPYAPALLLPVEERDAPYIVRLRRAGAVRGTVDGIVAGQLQIEARYTLLTSGQAEDPARVNSSTGPGALMIKGARISDDSSFTIDGLPPGHVRLIARLAGSPVPASAGVRVFVGTTNARLSLPGHNTLRGTMTVPLDQSADVRHVWLQLRRYPGEGERVIWSRKFSLHELANGAEFESPPLPDTLTYVLEGESTGPQGTLGTYRRAGLRPGPKPVGVALAPAASLSGTVVLENGRRAGAGVAVHAVEIPDDKLGLARLVDGVVDHSAFVDAELNGAHESIFVGLTSRIALTEGDGSFTIRGLKRRPHHLWIRSPLGDANKEAVVPGQASVQLTLRRTAARITGRMALGASESGAGFVVEARRLDAPRTLSSTSAVRSDGYFDLRGLAPGAYYVLAYSPTSPMTCLLTDVRAGTRRLRMEPWSGEELAGNVYGEGGEPAGPGRVVVRSDVGERAAGIQPDGSFRVTGLHGSRYHVAISVADGRSAVVVADSGDPVLKIVVK